MSSPATKTREASPVEGSMSSVEFSVLLIGNPGVGKSFFIERINRTPQFSCKGKREHVVPCEFARKATPEKAESVIFRVHEVADLSENKSTYDVAFIVLNVSDNESMRKFETWTNYFRILNIPFFVILNNTDENTICIQFSDVLKRIDSVANGGGTHMSPLSLEEACPVSCIRDVNVTVPFKWAIAVLHHLG